MKTASPNPVTPGGLLTYTLVVSNAGPNDAQNVVLTDNTPPSITGPEFSINGGVTFNPWTGSFSLGTLPSGTSRTILIRGTVSPSATGILTNTATVSSPTPDPNPSNNTSTVNTEITPVVPEEADISVIKTANPNPVIPGGLLTYTLVVSNAGPNDAQNVVLTDNIPPSITGPEFSINGGVTFNPWTGSLSLGTLPSGTSKTILIRGIVNLSATGCINNTAIATSTTPDPNLINNVSSICVELETEAEEADVSVVKIASSRKVCVGDCLEFTIIVSNTGPNTAQNVTLVDNVENILKKAVFSLDQGITWNLWTGRLVIGTLPAGAERVIILNGIIKSMCDCTITNIADVTSTTPDPNLNNNTSTVMVQINRCCCKDNCCNDGCCKDNCCNDCNDYYYKDNGF
nr:DUF11 domain-containing protein [Paeniclostridium sordellii]